MIGGIVFLIFIAIFLAFLFGLFSIAEGRPTRRRPTSYQPPYRQRSEVSTKTNTTAQQAMHRAGYQGGPNYVQVEDIGLLAYRTTTDPKLIRSGDLWADTQYLRPFAALWLPYAATGEVRFELLDANDRVWYADETSYNLQHGTNTLLPQTWLPLANKTISPGRWKLRVLANDTVLAIHSFGWQSPANNEIKQYVDSDGEISPELQQAINDVQSHSRMSLAELLASQDD
jgi:hypothetical protein